MKTPTPHRLRTALLWLPLLGAACAPPPPPPAPDAGPGEQCQVDLLYSEDTAEALTLGEEVSGTLCPARDKDWYRFTVTEPGSVVVVHLWMDTNVTNVEPGYSILRAGDETAVVPLMRDEGKSAGEPVDFTGAHRIDEAGDYLITVADVEGFDDRVDISNKFHLTVDIVPDPDGNEPNEAPDAATPLAAGGTATGLIGTTGDEDWYAVPVESDAQVIDVWLRAPLDVGVDLLVALYGPDGRALIEEQPVAEGDMELRARLRSAGAGSAGTTYFVRVLDEGGDNANTDVATGTYELAVQVLADPDPHEAGARNDTVATAVAAPSGQSFDGALASRSDQDLFLITPPAGTSRSAPRVLIVDLAVDSGVGAEVQPQLRVLAHDPEDADGALAQCGACPGDPCLPLPSGQERCGRVMLQRVLTTTSSYRTAFPLRSTRPVYVAINDFGDDGFQDGGGYTVSFEVIADPDPGERGDDYLIPNLQNASYDNRDELREQTARSKDRARDISAPDLLESCPIPAGMPAPDAGVGGDAGAADGGVDAGPAPTCMPVVAVPSPGPGGQIPWYVECTGQEWTMQATGRLTYEGDRDFFRFDVPEAGYWALDLSYSTTSATPVELAFFVHSQESLLGSWLEAQQTGGGCQTSTECAPGSVCIDGRCWADVDDNPAIASAVFPRPGEDQCLYVHVNDTRPVYLEVTDNGINDFDTDMDYTFNIRVRCGCPSECDGNFNACQGVAPPQ